MRAKVNGTLVDFSLTVGRQIRGRQNGYDLGDLESGPVTQMFLNPEVFARCVWANYGDRLEAVGIESEEAFFDAVSGQVRRELENAVKEAIADFFAWGPTIVESITESLSDLKQKISRFAPSGPQSGSMQELSA